MDYGLHFLSCLMAIHLQGIKGTGFTHPPNRAIVAGGSVEFICAALGQPPEFTTYVAYDECITKPQPDCRRISADDRIVYTENGGDPARAERYSVRRGNNDFFILNITDALLDDAGTYRCSAFNADHEGYNELIILDGEPRCTRNTTKDNEAIQGEFIRHECEAPYRGRWGPLMRFHATQREPLFVYFEDKPDNHSEADISRFSVTFEIAPKHNGVVFEADVYYTTDREGRTNLGPTYWFEYSFEPLTVLFPPVDITFRWDRRTSCLDVGKNVTCHTLANPTPTYQWIDVNTGQIVGNIPKLEVTPSMLGTGSYRCHVENKLGVQENVVDLEFCNKPPPTTEPPSTVHRGIDRSPTVPSGEPSLNDRSLPFALTITIGLVIGLVWLEGNTV